MCAHSGGQMRAAGTRREAKETRKPLGPRIQLKPLGRGLETLSSVPGNDGGQVPVEGLAGRLF